MSDWLNFTDGKQRKVSDGDGLVNRDGDLIRVAGMDAYEVPHYPDDIYGTNQGLEQKKILRLMIEDQGYDNLKFLGATAASQKLYEGEKKDRELAIIENKDGTNVASKLYYEGLMVPRGSNVSESDIQIWEQGMAARKRNPQGQDPYYEKLREDLAIASQLDIKFPKQLAITERDFNPKVHSGVMYRHHDRDMYNNADNPLIAGISGGLDGMQAGYYGVLEMLGDRMGIAALEKYAKQKVELQAMEQSELPFWVANIDDIHSVADFGSWAAGALGGSLPYFGLMAAGFIPGFQLPAFASMALVYTGQTWNAMKGLPDQKSAGIAVTAGILQSLWERLGGYTVFRLVKPADLGTRKGVNKAIDEIVKSGRKSSTTGKVITRKEADHIIKRAKKDEIIKMLKDFKANGAIWSAYASQVAKRAGAGVVGEGTTEAAQEATQYIGAYLGSPESLRKFDLEEFSSIIKNAAAAGALLGGGIAGGKGALTEKHPYSTSVRQGIFDISKNKDVDTSPVTPIKTKVDEMAEKHLDPADNFNAPTRKTQTAVDLNEKTTAEIYDESPALEAKNFKDRAAELKERWRVAADNASAFILDSETRPSDADIDKYYDENVSPVHIAYLEAEIAYDKLMQSRQKTQDQVNTWQRGINEKRKKIAELRGEEFVEQKAPTLAQLATRIKRGWSTTAEAEKEAPSRRQQVITKNEQNSEDVQGFIKQFRAIRDAMSGTSKTAKWLLEGEWISAPMQVLRMKLGDVWNNLDTLRAEGEYVGSPFERFFSGNTLVEERRRMDGEANEFLTVIMNDVLKSMRTRGRPLKQNEKNRRMVFDLLREYVITKELKPEHKGLEIPFGIALAAVNEYETVQEALVRTVDPTYTRPAREKILITNPDGTTEWKWWSMGIFLNKKLNPEKVTKNKEIYINAMMKVHKWSREEAELEYDKIAGVPTGWDYQEWADTKFLTKKPSYLKTRVEYSDPAFKELWGENDYDSALTRATEVAHYVSDMRSKGFGGARLNSKILAIRDEVKRKYGDDGVAEYMPMIAFELYRHYELHMGEYHKLKNDRTRALAAHAGSLMSFAYMAMAVIASIPEIALMFRDMTGRTVDGERMFVRATKNLAKLTKESMIAQMKKIHQFEGEWANTEFRDKQISYQVARGMTGKEYTAGHIVDAEYGMDRKHWMQAKAMPMFYKWTGLTPYTTWVRMGRNSFADDWIAVQVANITQLIAEVQAKFEEDYRAKNPLAKDATEEEKRHYEEALVKRINKFSSPGEDNFQGVSELQNLVHAFSLNNKQALSFKKLRNSGVDPVQMGLEFQHLFDWYTTSKLQYLDPIVEGRGKFRGQRFFDTEGNHVDPIMVQSAGQVSFDEWLDFLQAHPIRMQDLKTGEWRNYPELEKIKDMGLRLSKNLDIARSNFVDQALVNPDPSKRPPMYSDGRTRLLFMFQGYLAQFSSKIARPILRDLAGKGAPQDQINAAAVMLGALALGFLGQAFKDEIKYGDKPAWLSDAEYIQRGIMASGLMGQTERIFNFIFPLYTSEEDTLADKFWAEFGPLTGTIDSLVKGSKWAAEGEGERALNQYLKVTPAGSFTQQRQFMAKLLAGNLNDGE